MEVRVSNTARIVLVFDTAMQKGTGTISIASQDDIRSVDVSSAEVVVVGNKVTITPVTREGGPDGPYDSGSRYYVSFGVGVLRTTAEGCRFSGIQSTAYYFTIKVQAFYVMSMILWGLFFVLGIPILIYSGSYFYDRCCRPSYDSEEAAAKADADATVRMIAYRNTVEGGTPAPLEIAEKYRSSSVKAEVTVAVPHEDEVLHRVGQRGHRLLEEASGNELQEDEEDARNDESERSPLGANV